MNNTSIPGQMIRVIGTVVWCVLISVVAQPTLAGSEYEEAHEAKQPHHEDRHKEYITGTPIVPTQDWVLASGGRLYDNWMNAQQMDEIETTHPSWPSSNTKKKGAVTWRCKSCHGWDYKGVEGKYGTGSYRTGIKGVIHMQGVNPESIVSVIRDGAHQYTKEMISDDLALRIGFFIARGLHDADAYVDRTTGNTRGNAARGARIFQNVCAACHGFQGTKLDWGEEDEHAYVGTESNSNPWEVLHKIRNGHPGHEMVALRSFAMDVTVDVLAYARTLPDK